MVSYWFLKMAFSSARFELDFMPVLDVVPAFSFVSNLY